TAPSSRWPTSAMRARTTRAPTTTTRTPTPARSPPTPTTTTPRAPTASCSPESRAAHDLGGGFAEQRDAPGHMAVGRRVDREAVDAQRELVGEALADRVGVADDVAGGDRRALLVVHR